MWLQDLQITWKQRSAPQLIYNKLWIWNDRVKNKKVRLNQLEKTQAEWSSHEIEGLGTLQLLLPEICFNADLKQKVYKWHFSFSLMITQMQTLILCINAACRSSRLRKVPTPRVSTSHNGHLKLSSSGCAHSRFSIVMLQVWQGQSSDLPVLNLAKRWWFRWLQSCQPFTRLKCNEIWL